MKMVNFSAVLQTVAKRCLSSRDSFFESAAETNSGCNGLKKKPFQQMSGIINIFIRISKCLFLVVAVIITGFIC